MAGEIERCVTVRDASVARQHLVFGHLHAGSPLGKKTIRIGHKERRPDSSNHGVAQMDGEFAHRHVQMDWNFEEDGDFEAGKQWVFKVSLGDISVARRYPDPLSQSEAEAAARKIAAELFRLAEAWLS
jgi:hypothetical protein